MWTIQRPLIGSHVALALQLSTVYVQGDGYAQPGSQGSAVFGGLAGQVPVYESPETRQRELSQVRYLIDGQSGGRCEQVSG